MKENKNTKFLIIFILASFFNLLNSIEIEIPKSQAEILAHKIFKNETNLHYSNLLQWNANEKFLSLGIAHFIWYPDAETKKFVESFPKFISYLESTNFCLPSWLNSSTTCPWNSEEQFNSGFDSSKRVELYRFLQNTQEEQTKFLVLRLQEALPKIINASDHKEKVKKNINELATTANGIYAMLDYVNFKGEGLNALESCNGYHWGLLQVLEKMENLTDSPAHDFADAAKYVLKRRVKMSPHEQRWLSGWYKRIETYYE